MRAEITFSQLYWNVPVLNFFFRTQSIAHMYELLSRAEDKKKAIKKIEDIAEDEYHLDGLEEDFYNMSVEELAEYFNIELKQDK